LQFDKRPGTPYSNIEVVALKAVCLVCSVEARRAVADLFGAEMVHFADSPEAALERIALIDRCLFLLEDRVSPAPLDGFLDCIAACNRLCRTVLFTKDTQLNLVLPYLLDCRLDGYYSIREHAAVTDSTESDAAAMLRDILSMEYVHDLIYGHIGRLNEIKVIFSSVGIDILPQFVLTVVVDDFWSICEELHNRARYELKRNLLNSTRTAMEGHINGVATTLIGTDKVVVVLNCGERTGAAAIAYAVACAEHIKEYTSNATGYSISIGVSDYCEQPAFLWRAYEQSFRSLRSSFQKGKNQVLRYKQPTSAHESPLSLEPEQAKHGLIIGISTGDTQHCERAMDELLSELLACNYDEISIKSLVVVLLSEITQYCIQIGFDSSEMSTDLVGLIGAVFKRNSIVDINALLKGYLRKLVAKTQRSDTTERAMDIARAYLEQYYMNDLTLQEIATLCGYSSSYFSRSFKEHFHLNFVQYLARLRVEKAKALLLETSMTISEIAEKAGFQSMSYFSYTFKKETGWTPNQYRGSDHR